MRKLQGTLVCLLLAVVLLTACESVVLLPPSEEMEPGVRLRIAIVTPIAEEEVEPVIQLRVVTVTPTPERVGEQVPEMVVQQVLETVARQTGLSQEALRIASVEQVEFPSSALGCPQPGQFYLQVITPGYRFIVRGDGETFNVHTNLEGTSVVLCNNGETVPQRPTSLRNRRSETSVA